jgi:Right handed beta helix region
MPRFAYEKGSEMQARHGFLPTAKSQRPARGRRVVLSGVAALSGLAVGGGALVALSTALPAGAAGTCTAAGTTGLTASVIATTGQTITNQMVDATGCNIGIYIGPSVTNVTVNGATVENATDHGILAEDTTGITVENSTVENNGFTPTAGIGSDKAVMFNGVTDSTISGNTVQGNGGGGITVADDGPTDPGAPNPGPATAVPSSNDMITNNDASGNFGGCGILLEAWDAHGGVTTTTISGNTVTGKVGVFGPHGPVIGQIVLAVDGVGSTLTNNTVSDNTVSASLPAGIVVHANTPNSVISGTVISGNTLSLNNWSASDAAPVPTATALIVNPLPTPIAASISGTQITGNLVSQEVVDVWQQGATGTTISGEKLTGVPVPEYTVPAPGGGYRLVASDGGIFTFGNAVYDGSLPGSGIKPPAPVVGLTQTRDLGGYWIADANGDVYSFGNATFYGSVASKADKLTAPIVGITGTPVGPQITPNPNTLGYWLVGSDGNVYAFGDAQSFGNLAGKHLNKPIVALVPTADGMGYWLVASDGGVFSFGDAIFYGSTGNLKLNKPIVSGMATPSGQGYWLVASDGGVFSFGDAKFFGSTGDKKLNAPIVSAIASPSGAGYSLVASDGGVFTFGDAGFFGSTGNLKLVKPVTGIAGS